MLASTNHRDFNRAMNNAARTNGIDYSPPWDLGVTSGKDFLHNSYDVVGRRYGQELLHNPKESVLHDYRGGLSNFQKALVQHLVQTTTKHDFDEALHACTRHNVMSGGAAVLFSPHVEVTPRVQPRVSVTRTTEDSLRSAMPIDPVESVAPSIESPVMDQFKPTSPTEMLDAELKETHDTDDMDLNLDDDMDLLKSLNEEEQPSASRTRLAPLGRRSGSQPALKLMPKRKKPKT